MGVLTQLQGPVAYLAIFVLLYVSGAGVPVPEELPLALGGYLVAIGNAQFAPLAGSVLLALMLGDLTAYWLGRTFGTRLTRVPPFRWFVTDRHLSAVQEQFARHHAKAIFFGRFVAGVRLVTFIFSGMTRVSVVKFVVLDLAAACLTAPVPILLAYFLGDLARARKIAGEVDLGLAALVLGSTLVVIVIILLRRRAQAQAKPNQQPTKP